MGCHDCTDEVRPRSRTRGVRIPWPRQCARSSHATNAKRKLFSGNWPCHHHAVSPRGGNAVSCMLQLTRAAGTEKARRTVHPGMQQGPEINACHDANQTLICFTNYHNQAPPNDPHITTLRVSDVARQTGAPNTARASGTRPTPNCSHLHSCISHLHNPTHKEQARRFLTAVSPCSFPKWDYAQSTRHPRHHRLYTHPWAVLFAADKTSANQACETGSEANMMAQM